ncbi:phosphotransferase family protein [Gordonia liuliyuniae]|uniref:Phosphotransferase family protein n=1 Tax=Gordonia liuliyuniae TaxID=2911517 RepID=A0ABS9IP28_9ACTN|nr:phosphotransferase family protein [Gordonia liuliyuniae]MCF8587325.1 phosphotransferase family protein [Gordonia liuliyuniae]
MDDVLEEMWPRVAKELSTACPGVRLVGLDPLTGGASSLTYIARLDGADDVVVKVAPPGFEPVRNRDVLRQAALMRALTDHGGVRVPGVVFAGAGGGLDSPPFFAMDLVPGRCEEPVLQPVGERAVPAEVEARAYDAAVAMAELHAVRPGDLNMEGEARVGIRDEIERWTRAFETVPADLQGDFQKCAELLEASIPLAMEPVVNHGDYRLGNTLCSGGRVTAIIDWEIWSLGDPRIDLTWLTFFTDEAGHPAAEPGAPVGTPTKAELIAAYETAAGVSLADMDWFDALTKYKEAAATALLLKRGRRGGAMPPAMRRMVDGVPRLLDEVRAVLA